MIKSFCSSLFTLQIYKAKFDVRITTKYEIKALIGRGSFSRVVRVSLDKENSPNSMYPMP